MRATIISRVRASFVPMYLTQGAPLQFVPGASVIRRGLRSLGAAVVPLPLGQVATEWLLWAGWFASALALPGLLVYGFAMYHSDIQERLRFLQSHLSRLLAANKLYHKKLSHSPTDVEAHRRREERLHDILNEMADMGNRIKAA